MAEKDDNQSSSKEHNNKKTNNSKRKVVVSHSPVQQTKKENKAHPEKKSSQADLAYEEEALLASLHRTESHSAKPSFTPQPDLEEESVNVYKPSKLPLILSLITFFTTLGVGIVGWQFYFKLNQSFQSQDMAAQFNRLTEESNKQYALILELKKALETKSESQLKFDKTQSSHLAHLQSQLEVTQRQIGIQNRNEQDWMLAEVHYLINSAEQRLRLFEDIETAIHQLKAADLQLKNINEPMLIEVREAIAEDIHRLKTLKLQDRQGIWVKLSQLEKMIQKLPFKKFTNFEKDNSIKGPILSGERDLPLWKKAALNSWHEIKSLISIKSHDNEFKPEILSDNDRTLLLHAITLQIAEAKQAVLKGDEAIYHSSLESIKHWLLSYFTSNSTQQDVLKDISSLASIPIKNELPIKIESLSSLKTVLDDRTRTLFKSASMQEESE